MSFEAKEKSPRACLTEAQQQLALAHMKDARRIGWHICRRCKLPSDLSEDIESEVWLALCQAARTFRPERGTTFGTWLFIKVRGAILDMVKNRAAGNRVDLGEYAHYLARGVEEQDLDRMILLRDVRRCVAALPSPHRRLLELRYYADLALPEVAESIGCISKSWACRLEARALSELREQW